VPPLISDTLQAFRPQTHPQGQRRLRFSFFLSTCQTTDGPNRRIPEAAVAGSPTPKSLSPSSSPPTFRPARRSL